jgi:hypothetical protein
LSHTLGNQLFSDDAANLQRELEKLTEEGKSYVARLHDLAQNEEEAGEYSYESYSRPLDDVDIPRHRADNAWTKRVTALFEGLDQLTPNESSARTTALACSTC